MFTHVQRLLSLRAAHPALRRGPSRQLLATEQQLVYQRGDLVIALNNDTVPVTLTVSAPVSGGDALGRCAAPRTVGAATTLALPARGSCVFVPRP